MLDGGIASSVRRHAGAVSGSDLSRGTATLSRVGLSHSCVPPRRLQAERPAVARSAVVSPSALGSTSDGRCACPSTRSLTHSSSPAHGDRVLALDLNRRGSTGFQPRIVVRWDTDLASLGQPPSPRAGRRASFRLQYRQHGGRLQELGEVLSSAGQELARHSSISSAVLGDAVRPLRSGTCPLAWSPPARTSGSVQARDRPVERAGPEVDHVACPARVPPAADSYGCMSRSKIRDRSRAPRGCGTSRAGWHLQLAPLPMASEALSLGNLPRRPTAPGPATVQFGEQLHTSTFDRTRPRPPPPRGV